MSGPGFSFNFYEDETNETDVSSTPVGNKAANVPVELKSLNDLIQCIPEKLSYARVDGLARSLYQRELWDVKVQLMTLDTNQGEEQEQLKVLEGANDLVPMVYEGGYKTWECSIDLANKMSCFLKNQEAPKNAIEIGCGSALPLLTVFSKALETGISGTFVFQDYNLDVLKYITVPNLFLNWYALTHGVNKMEDVGAIDVTQSLLQNFLDNLQRLNITCAFLSGPWGTEMEGVIAEKLGRKFFEIVLSSETIYSLNSLSSLMSLLQFCTKEHAFIAGKNVYFGVGGSILEFVTQFQKLISESKLEIESQTKTNIGRSIVIWSIPH
ncbi:S-adenosylmethionine-dependent methyltransferase [Schizosaccharomyces japonicus yFS275]|uniref:protein-histidine N-methyltransferase n=1 Tax=Schizosaccharomyces japonicus (strain yFS275 / FY16936) TaxID=402676 RepID=B6K1E2_SCHJY|nr:S-adenosylmethionine-dependent methyltransferase [Schizosaccharomyces japonicus yFS275]EEB07763.1 S-adenosylmethionine-dependent methyltransferase [Schizosaccharomyces japonicus yFS275]